jgi:hypothetical protein
LDHHSFECQELRGGGDFKFMTSVKVWRPNVQDNHMLAPAAPAASTTYTSHPWPPSSLKEATTTREVKPDAGAELGHKGECDTPCL